MSKKILLPLIFGGVLLTLCGCFVFNNPVDPKAADYQGYPTDPLLPNAPANLAREILTVDADTQILLTWIDNAETEDGFRVEMQIAGGGGFGEAAGSPAAANPGSGGTVEFLVTGLDGETEYDFRVYAYNGDGQSGYSNTLAVATGPIAPSNLILTPAAGQITLNWTDNSSAETGFIVERSTDGVSYTGLVGAGLLLANTTTWQNTGLGSGATFWYRVSTYNDNGRSGFTPAQSAALP